MTDPKEPLPCPFCGSRAAISSGDPVALRWRFVQCQNSKCGAKSKASCQDERAIAAWNRRAGHTYPHMCRDGHPEIGHATDEEMCPVCIARNRRAPAAGVAGAGVWEALEAFRKMIGGQKWDSRWTKRLDVIESALAAARAKEK